MNQTVRPECGGVIEIACFLLEDILCELRMGFVWTATKVTGGVAVSRLYENELRIGKSFCSTTRLPVEKASTWCGKGINTLFSDS